MAKKMRRKVSVLWDTALAIAGWIAFVIGFFIKEEPLALLLLVAARVLP